VTIRSEPWPGRILRAPEYARDTLSVARRVLGCLLCRREPDGRLLVGRILEVEAYIGEDDPACHAAAGRTPRTRVLYGPPGRAYIYFTYGMHHLLNFVTEPEGVPAAVLVRAVRPLSGIPRMAARRGTSRADDLARGPGRLCQALGIDLALNEAPLTGPVLAVCDDGAPRPAVAVGPRVGIRRGTERPWRFWIRGDPGVSRLPTSGAAA
jgi:DNA-3-methyladenine glycosylase